MRRAAPSLPGPPREVRIIGGSWKRSKLPVADRPGLRPTPDRVRETLFNWLGQDLSGWRCLDAFAGSGALGFEAASRGAAEAVLLERDPALVALLESHGRFIEFLWSQQALRLRDPEAWLDSDHDKRFMVLWRDHRGAVHALADRLRESVRDPIVDAEPESVFPA